MPAGNPSEHCVQCSVWCCCPVPAVLCRSDNKKLKTHNEYLRTRMEKSLRRQRELEECTTQHGQLQDKMRERLKQMDAHAGHNSQQVSDTQAQDQEGMIISNCVFIEYLHRSSPQAENSVMLNCWGKIVSVQSIRVSLKYGRLRMSFTVHLAHYKVAAREYVKVTGRSIIEWKATQVSPCYMEVCFVHQILDLLAKESSLMRDRHLLASEVEFLRRQVLAGDRKDSNKHFSSTRHMVDEILNNVRYEQDLKEKEIVDKFAARNTQDFDFTAGQKVPSEKEESIDTPTEDEIDLE